MLPLPRPVEKGEVSFNSAIFGLLGYEGAEIKSLNAPCEASIPFLDVGMPFQQPA